MAKISAKFDQKKLEKSLKDYAKKYGETQSQAVVRWSIQACRELAMETQVWGRVKTKIKQDKKIISDALRVLIVVDRMIKPGGIKCYLSTNQGVDRYVTPQKALLSVESVNRWIDINRTRRRRNTAKLPIEERRVCTKAIFDKAMRERKYYSGMAKGAWLGAGQQIAKAQTGQDKISIGKNLLSYAQKHVKFGSAVKPIDGWRPTASITNSVEHSASRDVLAKSAIDKAIQFGLKKTLKYYRKAVKALDKKN